MRILVADDSDSSRAAILDAMNQIFPETEIDAYADSTAAWEAARSREYDLILTDADMPKMPGNELAEKIRSVYPHAEVFYVTGEEKFELEKSGIDIKRCIFKPYIVADIRRCLYENELFRFGSFGNELRL